MNTGTAMREPTSAPAPAGDTPGRTVVRRLVMYGTARALTEGLLGLRGLVLATLLGPAGFGGWALMKLALGYAGFAALGAHRGLELELTRSRSQAQPGGRELPGRTALGFLLAVFGVIAAASIAASFAVADPARAFELRAFAGAILSEQLYVYGLVSLRVRASLRQYATLELVHAVLQVVCTCLGALEWGLRGALGGLVLGHVLALGFLPGRVPLRPALSAPVLRRLLRVGFPLAITLAIGRLLATGDRLTVVTFGGRPLLGQYAFAVAVAGLAGSAGWVMRTVVFPDVYRRAQSGGIRLALEEHLARALLPFAHLFPPLLGLAALCIRPAVALFAPTYEAAGAAAETFIFTGVAGGIASLGGVGLVAADRQRVLPLLAAAGTAINLLGSLLALRLGGGLQAVAVAALLAQTGYGLAIVALTLHSARGAVPRTVVRAAAPLLWCAAAVAIARGLEPGADPRSTGLALSIYVALLAPLVPMLRTTIARARGLL
ncbi:MAG TPA: hypothetical protein VFU46_06305 [Gemmatimonadales bacterium]|nr:hypothetical protein [Gemmatimonadales bacterium]